MSSRSDGQTLIEIVVVAGILAMMLTVVMSLVTTAVRRNRIAKEHAVATKLTNEAVEWLRNERERLGWTNFYASISSLSSGSNRVCLCLNGANVDINELESNSCSQISSCSQIVPAGSSTGYYRMLQLDLNSNTNIGYEVVTQWQRGIDLQTVNLKGNLVKRYEGS